MLYQLIASVWCLAIVLGSTIRGQFVGVTPELELEKPVQFLNSDNLLARTSVTLVNLETLQRAAGLVDQKLRFSFKNVAVGSYELIVYSHDFVLGCDRYKVTVDKESTLAYEDHLDAIELSEPVDVTTKPLLITVNASKKYYENRLGSLQDMVLNSPLGPIFKNRLYTAMFAFTVVMMVAPYLLQFINPELAKQMKDLQSQGFQEKPLGQQPKAPIKS